MHEFRVLADMRFWPTSGLGKVESAIVSRKPPQAVLDKLPIPGKYGHPLSTVRIARALRGRAQPKTVFWSAGFLPPLHSSVPVVVTVHDLTHLHYYEWKRKYYFNYVFPPLYRRCTAIVCVSEHTRQELMAWSGVRGDRVHVAHNGFDPTYLANDTKLDLGYRYVLYAGNHRPYKNIGTLVRAYAASGLSEQGVHLAITGVEDQTLAQIARETGCSAFVHFLGSIPEGDMPKLYHGAETVAYISLYEGFGLPILEAMASRVPVVTSNVSSMPEVAGDAAMIVNPLSVGDVAAALRETVLNAERRSSLVQKGLGRIQDFSWDKSAAKVWTLLEQLALGGSPDGRRPTS